MTFVMKIDDQKLLARAGRCVSYDLLNQKIRAAATGALVSGASPRKLGIPRINKIAGTIEVEVRTKDEVSDKSVERATKSFHANLSKAFDFVPPRPSDTIKW